MAQTGILKIAVLGAESTGKSALCEKLAQHYATVWVPEYARTYFNDSDIYNYSLNDLEKIAERQLQMENELLAKANRVLFCDTTLITLKIWAQLEFNAVPQSIEAGLQQADYGLYLLTNNDVPWECDPLRQNKFSRDSIFEMNTAEVKNTGVPYAIISGTGEERTQHAVAATNRLLTPPLAT